jgi:putative NADH-flavin reductase
MRIVLLLSLLPALTQGFAPAFRSTRRTSLARPASLNNNDNNNNEDGMLVDRRNLFQTVVTATAASTLAAAAFLTSPTPALALLDSAALKKVVVAGSTGQTGRRILERLASIKGLSVIAGVRDPAKAKAALEESSTVIRGAMVQQVASIDIASSVDLKHLDVVKDSVDELAATLQGAEALVIATGFIPGNPLKMNEQAHLVDNVGTCALIDAAKQAGVKKVVMVSSILTNGRNWGQEQSPGFVITNAFGRVLDEKIVAENHLRASGLDYVRYVNVVTVVTFFLISLYPCPWPLAAHCLLL